MMPGRPRAAARVNARPRYMGITPAFSTDPSTIAAVNVGPTFLKRVHFGISWSASNNRTLDSVTFAGSPCARDVRAFEGIATGNLEWWSIETALESGDLGMDWSGGINGGVAAVFWAPRTGALTKSTGAFADIGSGSAISATCNTYAGGYLLAGARWGAARTTTWTGADEVYDAGNVESFALLPASVAETARPITATLSSAASLRLMALLAVR